MKKRQRAQAQQRRYFRPDITHCPTCGSPLKRCYNLWRKNLILLSWGV